MNKLAFNTVWRSGGGTQWIRWTMTSDEFKTQDKIYFDQGLRITSFDIDEGKISAVWQPGNGTQWVNWGMSDSEFKTLDTTYFNQGLRITCIELDNGKIAAVWHVGSGTQWVHWNLSIDEFHNLDQNYFSQGLRIQCLTVHDGKISAVWHPGSGTQWVHIGMSFDELATLDKTYFASGLRLKVLLMGGSKYAAVWQPGSGTQWWSTRRCEVDFKTEDASYFTKGLRVASLKICNSPFGAYKYPWKGGDTYDCGQGNNNTSGSHNGSQSFAFDFSLPTDTEVRAARGGVVEWLQQIQTTHYDPTSPTTASNKPYPNGDLQNWGNAVRIRHAGGFTSWYFHLKTNSVVVKVGDNVVQGQLIAKSNNTGRTSGAHLHFQVQADSKDWGQSVACTFGLNCKVPTGGDSAKSDNAK
jgi:hypothetical protein